jgi:drug/metabolite transporter (DMT)-like permease
MISPFTYIVIAFLSIIVYGLYTKHSLKKLDGYGIAILTNLLAGLIMLPFVFFELPKILNFGFLEILLILLTGVLCTYSAWAGNLSIAQNNFSFKEIVRQTRVIWVVLAGVFLLGEQVTVSDIMGIILIISSVYIVSFRTISFKEHISSRSVLLAWSMAFVAAAIALLEKIVLSFDTVTVSAFTFLLYVLTTFFLIFFLNKKRIVVAKDLLKNNFRHIFILTCLMMISFFAILMSYKLLPISVAYPLIQSSTVVGVLIGTFLFEEGKDWRKKLFATLVAIAGVIVIKLI